MECDFLRRNKSLTLQKENKLLYFPDMPHLLHDGGKKKKKQKQKCYNFHAQENL